MALCIDKNDNHMSFVGHIVYMPPKSYMWLSYSDARNSSLFIGQAALTFYLPGKTSCSFFLLPCPSGKWALKGTCPARIGQSNQFLKKDRKKLLKDHYNYFKAMLLDILQTEDSYIDVDTIIVKRKKSTSCPLFSFYFIFKISL